MDLRNVESFIRVAELGSFTKAASEMNYVQSTVTMQIQQLEKELGVCLFDRIGKRVSLTSAGEEFLGCANEIMGIMERAGSIGKDGGSVKGTLRIGVLESLLFSHLVELLPEFKREYENVNVEITMGQAADLLVQLKQSQLDMVYISANLSGDEDLKCWFKKEERLVFLAAPGHALARKEKVCLAEVFEYDFLVTERSGGCYRRLQELAAGCDMVVSHSLMVDSTVVIADLVQRGMGLAFLPEYSVARLLQEGKLVKLDVDLEEQVYYRQIFCHKDRWVAPFMGRMMELIGEAVVTRPPQ